MIRRVTAPCGLLAIPFVHNTLPLGDRKSYLDWPKLPYIRWFASPVKRGDVVVFNHNLMHASFGGSTQRRMFTLNCAAHAETPEELQAYIRSHCLTWGDRVHSAIMRDTAGPGRLRHLQQILLLQRGI